MRRKWGDVKSSLQHCSDFGEHRRRVEVSRKSTAGFPLLVLLLWSKGQAVSFQKVVQCCKNNRKIEDWILFLMDSLTDGLHRKRVFFLFGGGGIFWCVGFFSWFTYEINYFPAGITTGNAVCSLHWFVNYTEKFHLYETFISQNYYSSALLSAG